MGIFDFLNRPPKPPPGPPVDKKVAGPGKVVADKRAQTYDRIEAIEALAKMKSPEAAQALLKRFTFTIDPSITDQEEKEMAFSGIVDAGEDVVPAVRKFCKKAETLTWPLKVFRELLDDDGYRKELLGLLEAWDTEYSRNVEPKIRIVKALAEVVNDDVRKAIEPFLDDVNETVRFHAVETTFSADDDTCLAALAALLGKEESVRVKNKVAEGVRQKAWAFPEELREDVRKFLRDAYEYELQDDGTISKGA